MVLCEETTFVLIVTCTCTIYTYVLWSYSNDNQQTFFKLFPLIFQQSGPEEQEAAGGGQEEEGGGGGRRRHPLRALQPRDKHRQWIQGRYLIQLSLTVTYFSLFLSIYLSFSLSLSHDNILFVWKGAAGLLFDPEIEKKKKKITDKLK